MCLGYIDDIERYPAVVLQIHLVERGSLPAKRRSSVAPEYKNYRLCAAKRGDCRGTRAVEERKRKIRSDITDLEVPGSRMLPQRFEWKQQQRCRPDMHHYPGERFRRLMHCVIEARQQCTIKYN